jgi:nanoRNase/pAp phosphatase (c-di-AMP/oligoRNAs hydrolase)
MELRESQQFYDMVRQAKRILLPLPARLSGDSIGSALACALLLRTLQKEVVVLHVTGTLGVFSFLPGASVVSDGSRRRKIFRIGVSTQRAELLELSYEVFPDRVEIALVPREGMWTKEDVTLSPAQTDADLIITLNVPSLEQLGPLYEQLAETFFETPVVNIDRHVENERYGTINLIDVTAASTAEILAEILPHFGESTLDADVATNLLCGIITETNSFQSSRTTPQAFLRAAQLIALGADQQGVIRNLYKSRPVSFFHLFGRALARLQIDGEVSLATSLLSSEDLTRASADTSAILESFRELASLLPEQHFVVLLVEREKGRQVEGFLSHHPNFKREEIRSALNGENLNANLIRFVSPKTTLHDAASEIRRLLRDWQSSRGK